MKSIALALAAGELLSPSSLILSEAEGFSFGFTSLAELAEMETDEIKTLDSRLFPAGLFAVRCTEASLSESTKEGTDPETGEPYLPLYAVNFKFEVLEADPLDKSIAKESLAGRVINQRKTFWPKSFQEEIGLVKGDYKRIGLPYSGKLGGLEGAEPGWLDGILDQVFEVKVTHSRPRADGSQFVNVIWQKRDQPVSGADLAGAESEEA